MKRIINTLVGIFCISTLALAQLVNYSNYGNWINIGPFGNPEVHWTATGNGALDFVEMHPTNPAIMYVAARNGGLWRTTNYGKNWTPLTDNFETPYCSCVEVCKANPSVIYMGAKQDSKVWYNTNSSSTWIDRSTGISGIISEIHSDPTNAARVLVATESGLFLSTNSGQSWATKLTGSYCEVDATDDWGLLIVSKNLRSGNPTFEYSKDKGDTWTSFTVATYTGTRIGKTYVAIQGSGSNIKVFAYAVKDGETPTTFIGLWKSNYSPTGTPFSFTRVQHPTYNYPNGPVPLVKSGTGFKEGDESYGGVNPKHSSSWVGDFFVDPNNANNMLTCQEKLWGSNDGGILWDIKPGYGESNWADNRYITTNIAKDTIYWCNDGGLWAISIADMFSGNNPNKVVSKNGDICVTEGGQMDVSQQNKNCFITGGQDIGQIFVRNGRDSHVASADVYRGRIKPTDDSKFITGNLNIKLGGTSYKLYDNIEADYFNADRIYGFTQTPVKLARSPLESDGWAVLGFLGENSANTGGGSWTPVNANWEEVNTGIANLKAGTFEQSRASANVAFIGDEVGQKLYITNNLSNSTVTWTQLTNAPALTKYRIATHANNVNFIVIASDNKVYVSTDKGLSWTEKTGFPGTSVFRVLIDKNTSAGIYVATEKTVYYTDETLSAWVEFSKGLPHKKNSDLRIGYYGNGDNNLFVSKWGRGVWRSPLYSTGSPVISKSGWTLKSVDSEETVGENGAAINAFDGDVNTIWHTKWTSTSPYPHEIQINLGALYLLTEFRYLPRQNGENTRIGNYQFYVSADGVNWGTAVATGTWANTTTEQIVKYTAKMGQYIRLVGLSAANGTNYAGAAEINVCGVPAQLPVISKAGWTLKSVDSEETVGENGAAINAFDSDVNTIWHTKWTSTSPYPHEIQINLGTSYILNEFRYLPRQNNTNTRIGNYQIYVSTDGSAWGTPVATGTWPNVITEQVVTFQPTTGRYLKLVGLSAANGTNYAGAAEINVCGIKAYIALNSPAVTPVLPFVESLKPTIADTEKELSLNCYPNPTFGNVSVSLKGKTVGDISIKVVNLSGQVLFQKAEYKHSDEFSTTINLENLPRQMYIVQVISKTGRSQRKVLLIDKPEKNEEHEE